MDINVNWKTKNFLLNYLLFVGFGLCAAGAGGLGVVGLGFNPPFLTNPSVSGLKLDLLSLLTGNTLLNLNRQIIKFPCNIYIIQSI